jgi:hypothetical protein
MPKDSVLAYEAALKSNGFLVMAHGSPEEMARAKAIMQVGHARQLHTHESATPAEAAPTPGAIG